MKAEAKHTPGPWQVVPAAKAEHPWVVGDAEGGSIASCEPMGPWMSAAEATANARLIAAAPEILAALKSLVGEWPPDEQVKLGDRIKQAQAAIFKAEGR